MRRNVPLLVALSFLLFHVVASRDIYTGLVNKQVVRNIDLTTQLARHTVDVTAENTGTKSTGSYYITIEKDFATKLAFLRVTSADEKELATKLEPTTSNEDSRDYVLYRVTLPKAIEVGSTYELKITLVFIHTMHPFPEKIPQSERQLVRYIDNHYWFSLYRTESVKTKVKLASSSVQSSSELSPSSVKGDVATYGPYTNVAPLSKSQLSLHFENNKPFLTVVDVLRWIEVSHWGNVAVEEKYHVRHDGAHLKGPFSRYDFQINAQANGQAAIQVLRQFLPGDASDVYYRDDIGNISTSHLRPGKPKQQFDFRPRFPLFGGWQTYFTLGYNLPSAPYLSTDASDPSKYVLNISFIAEWDFAISIDHQQLRVVLPEGATGIEATVPFEYDSSHIERWYTYLDVSWIGRPVLVIDRRNLVNEHFQNFQVTYHFSKSFMLLEPIMLITAFFAMFLVTILLLRIQLRISDAGHGSRDPKTVKVLEALSGIYEKRANHHSLLDSALQTFLSTSDSNAWNIKKKQIQSDLQAAKNYVTGKLGELSGEVAAKVREIEEVKEAAKEKAQNELIGLVQAHVEGKVSKQKFDQQYSTLVENYEQASLDLDEEIEALLGGDL